MINLKDKTTHCEYVVEKNSCTISVTGYYREDEMFRGVEIPKKSGCCGLRKKIKKLNDSQADIDQKNAIKEAKIAAHLKKKQMILEKI